MHRLLTRDLIQEVILNSKKFTTKTKFGDYFRIEDSNVAVILLIMDTRPFVNNSCIKTARVTQWLGIHLESSRHGDRTPLSPVESC